MAKLDLEYLHVHHCLDVCLTMSRSFKDQKSRRDRNLNHEWIAAFNDDDLDVASFQRIDHEQGRLRRDEGPHDAKRFGNQRKMRAGRDMMERRADRKRHENPMQDAQGERGLPSRPESPAKRRQQRWS